MGKVRATGAQRSRRGLDDVEPGPVGPPFTLRSERGAVLVTAIHAGHELRPAIAAHTALDDATRLREEDPFTDRLIPDGCASVVVHRSRFEIDLNRPRETAVYLRPHDAWGLDLWVTEPTDEELAASLEIYDEFYARVAEDLDTRAAAGPFVVLDLHSYNHRREGPDRHPAAQAENPEINVGTESINRPRWGPLVEGLVEDLAACSAGRHPLDVRENVKFRGGNLSRWVNERYASRGCAIAIEFKKVFMDEWTGEPDDSHVAELTQAVSSSIRGLVARLGDR